MYFRSWRNLRVQPKTAFSRFSPFRIADLARQDRVDLSGSPKRQSQGAVGGVGGCGMQTSNPTSLRSGQPDETRTDPSAFLPTRLDPCVTAFSHAHPSNAA